MSNNPVREFFRRHQAAVVGIGPPAGPHEGDAEDRPDVIDWSPEMEPDDWEPRTPSEQPAEPGEYPTRFIDGCHVGHAVTRVWAPGRSGMVALYLAEIGGIAMALRGRTLVREFYGLERVAGMVTDLFPWSEIEEFAAGLFRIPDLRLRLLPARRPQDNPNPFDYEAMRAQAEVRTKQEMANWESIALHADPNAATLLDGRLASRLLTATGCEGRKGLVVGVVKTHAQNYLHPQGWRTLYDLGPRQRTPFFVIDRRQTGPEAALKVATWYQRLAVTDTPEWGVIRVEVPWAQVVARWPTRDQRVGFVNRLAGWLIDVRCRQQSYARMPVSLEPIVRAEDSLKSLFTPFGLLRNRFLRHAGVFGSP
jgi:hypothetical protein